MEFDAPKKAGVFISTKILVVVGISIAAIFVGSILATYFGKHCDDCQKKCNNLYCESENILIGMSLK